MVNFCSCSHDTFKMSNKLINESYKVFCLVDRGYIFDFCFILCNRKIPSIEDTDNLNNTSVTVFSLTMSLPYEH